MIRKPPPNWRIKRLGEDDYHWWDGPLLLLRWLVMVASALVLVKLSERDPIYLVVVALAFGAMMGYHFGKRAR